MVLALVGWRPSKGEPWHCHGMVPCLGAMLGFWLEKTPWPQHQGWEKNSSSSSSWVQPQAPGEDSVWLGERSENPCRLSRRTYHIPLEKGI